MSSNLKRKYCEHCKEYVSVRTFRQHVDLYFNKKENKWEICGESSEEEDIGSDTSLSNSGDNNGDFEATSSYKDHENDPQGVNIAELETEDRCFIGLSEGESDDEFIYHEKRPELQEVWHLNDIDVDCDFRVDKNLPSTDVNAVGTLDKVKSLAHWLLLFVCLWSSFCGLSDNSMDILLSFLKAFFEALGSTVPMVSMVTGLAMLIPKSLHLLKNKLGLNQDKFIKFVVCPKCENLYNFEDCYTLKFGKHVSKKCTFVEFPHHRQQFRRTRCNEPLLREVHLKGGKTRLYPYKVYCYNSIVSTLEQFLQLPNFMTKLESWRNRNVPKSFLADVFDGRIWKEWQYVNGKPFLAADRNYAFMLNVDWFQPFKHSIYSVGAIYMVLMNLPRAERFKPENVFLVGIIPGPKEPKGNINTYLQPLVAELKQLWTGVKLQVAGSEVLVHGALLCVGCDIPATRKVCGSTGHGSNLGCSKCKKFFPGNVATRIDFSGFDPCELRTNKEHRQQAQDIQRQTSAGDRNAKESQYGTRFSELMFLPYFDCVRFHIVDPMHNLFTGTAKHVMKNIWIDSQMQTSPLINRNHLSKIQDKIDKVKAPSSIGRMPKKIENSYGGFTADQWKNFTLIYSVFALWDILPKPDLQIWQDFVMACSFFCAPVITEAKALVANALILKFCKEIEKKYGTSKITPNMHLHTHILNCILDYGPVYSFWLFSFERYNGILGEYGTNQKSVEIQLMRKFTSDQLLRDIPFPSAFQENFKPIFEKLLRKQTGTLRENVCDTSTGESEHAESIIATSLLSIGPLKKGVWASVGNLFNCSMSYSRDCLDPEFLPFLKEVYNTLFDEVDESSVTRQFERYSSCSFNAEKLGSSDSVGQRSSFILARWCKLGGKIDRHGHYLRPGMIRYFLKQNVKIGGQYVSCVFAVVHWFQEHPAKKDLGPPVEVWCRDLFEMDGPANFIPVQRIRQKFVPAVDTLKGEKVLVVCPLTQKIQV